MATIHNVCYKLVLQLPMSATRAYEWYKFACNNILHLQTKDIVCG